MKTICGFCLLIVFHAGHSTYSQDATGLKKLVETETAFADLAATKSVKQAFLDVFDDQGVVFQPAAMNAKKFWNGQPESSALLAWNPVWADISATGALGYTTGDWDFRPKGIDDKPILFGQYITIWKKQATGNFKAVLDIGISHAKPADVKKYWMSPAVMSEHRNRESDIAAPEFAFLTLDDYEKLLAHDVRIYREQKLPFIGKQNALTQIKSERARTKSGRVVGSSCASSGDLFYCYGVLEFTSNDDSVKKGNLVRIWKRRNDRWVITLEVFTPLPAGQ